MYPCFTDILLQNTLVYFLYTSYFITMNPIDLSCKVTSTTSNEVIPPQTTEVTSTTSNKASPPYSPPYHQTRINTNLTTCVMYKNKLIKIPTGLILQQPIVHLWNYTELITVPSGINLHIPKVHLWDYTKSPDQNFNRNIVPVNTPISSTSMQELNICTHCWQPVTGNVLMHKTVKLLHTCNNWILIWILIGYNVQMNSDITGF